MVRATIRSAMLLADEGDEGDEADEAAEAGEDRHEVE